MLEDNKYRELIEYALGLVSKRRYTCSEIQKKLENRCEEGKTIEKVIGRLCELNYLNDEIYVEDWVRNRRKLRPRGVYMMKQELLRKGVDKAIVESKLNDTNIDEYKDAIALLEKKRRVIEKLPEEKRRQKIFSILKNKGFRPQSIYKAIDSW